MCIFLKNDKKQTNMPPTKNKYKPTMHLEKNGNHF